LTDIRPDLTIHIVELGPIKWNLGTRERNTKRNPRPAGRDRLAQTGWQRWASPDEAAGKMSQQR